MVTEASKVKLQLSTNVEYADLGKFAEILIDGSAWPKKSAYRLYCPAHMGRNAEVEMATIGFQQGNWNKPNETWVKAITETGEIAAAAYWQVFDESPFKGGEYKRPHVSWYPPGPKREFVTQALEQKDAQRRAKMDRPHVNLNIIFANPKFRRLGAASLCMKYGTDLADRLRLDTWVHSSLVGVAMYETHGFRLVSVGQKRPVAVIKSKEWDDFEEELGVLVNIDLWRPVGGIYRRGQKKPWDDD